MSMLDLRDDDHPAKRAITPRPLTPLEKEQGLVVLLVFVLWLPVYLIWVRTAINRFLFDYVSSYPAMVHLFPIIGVPCLIAIAYAKLSRAWGRHP
jgi:hypothetical protein